MSLTLILLLIPVGLLVAIAVTGLLQPAPYPPFRKLLPALSWGVGTVSAFSFALYFVSGPQSLILSLGGIELLHLRFDVVSATLVALVGFVGAIVLAFSGRYLEGEARQGEFTAWLSLAMASVLMLVQSGHVIQLAVFRFATSFFLHKLLLFYPERRGAQRDRVAVSNCLLELREIILNEAKNVSSGHFTRRRSARSIQSESCM